MSAPDFYFAVNALFRYLHDRYGQDELVRYWRRLGSEYYAQRTARWQTGGAEALAADWREYFAAEPGARVQVTHEPDSVELHIEVCPAIKHLQAAGRQIVPYFCEHCDHVCGAMAEQAGYRFQRVGGMGSCRQRFVRLTVEGKG